MLNNVLGSYGTTPRPVLQAVRELSDRIEANPDLFHRVDVTPLMAKARGRVAQLVGADLDEIVFVPNASMGVSTVLWNFDWEEDDIIYACTSELCATQVVRAGYSGRVARELTILSFI